MIKRLLKRWIKDPSIKEEVQLCGHTFRVLDPFTMPKVRQAAYHLNEYEKGWGITKENLILTFKALREDTSFPKSYISNEDLTAQLTDKLRDITGLIDMVLMVIEQDYQFDPFIKSACNIILLDDEKADEIDQEYQRKKLALCNQYEEIMVFFLVVERHSMANIETSYATLMTSEPLIYPEVEKKKEKRFLSRIKR